MNSSHALKETSKDIFSAMWWDQFLESTSNLKKTTVFKNCLTTNETELMRNHVINIVAQLSQMRTSQFGYRVYSNDKLLDHREMESIYDAPPSIDESFEDWALRVFKENKFGIIINRGEKFCPELAEIILRKIDFLVKKIGLPRLGITLTIFIGNYGWTPIGIHTDAIGENVIHFHLGKGRKTMYTWERDKYEENTTLIERINNIEIEKHLHYSDKYDFGEGDLFFMPEGKYHVGCSNDLSMGLTLWFNNHSISELSRRAIQVIIDQYLVNNETILLPDTSPVGNFDGFREALNQFNIPEELENLTFKEILEDAYKDFRYSLYSNGGFWARPFPVERNFEFKLNTIIQKCSSYKILYFESKSSKSIFLYVRGTKLIFNNHKCIGNLVDEINKGDKIQVKDLIKVLDADWDVSIGLYIVNSIYLHHGIKIVSK